MEEKMYGSVRIRGSSSLSLGRGNCREYIHDGNLIKIPRLECPMEKNAYHAPRSRKYQQRVQECVFFLESSRLFPPTYGILTFRSQ